MRVLWFETQEPAAYASEKHPYGGWQDSLERIVRTIPEIELTVAFMSERHTEVKVVDGVRYIPIFAKWSRAERLWKKYWDSYVEKVLPGAMSIVRQYKPVLIQIFGIEWPFGQIAAHTDIPVVIHIMGSIVPYNNAEYSPGYYFQEKLMQCWRNPRKMYRIWRYGRDDRNREEWERRTWELVNDYMGRTQWDYALSKVMHPGRRYYHVEEGLHPVFVSKEFKWARPKDGKIHLISIGIGGFRKGPDMMLKVACILTTLGLDFEWNVAGQIDCATKLIVEKRVGISFEDSHIKILGFIQPEELVEKLCASTMYVHTAYIENSPNSICEAQCLGVPVVSTNVGGIATLVRQDVDGILVAANDPWQMADAIVELAKDHDRMQRYSENTRVFALARHNDENIKKQLMDCYCSLIRK